MITRRNYFVLFCQQEDCWRANRSRVLNAVEVPRDLQRDWTGQQPEIPPAESTQDHLAQRRWIVQNQSGDPGRPGRSHVERNCPADACSERHDWPIPRVTFQFIKDGKRGGPDLRKPRWSRAPAESGIIHSPDFYSTVIPHLGFGGCPAISAIRVAV